MKITKTFVCVFLATFLIGYVSVLPTNKVYEPKIEQFDIPQEVSTSKIEQIPDVEMVEDVDNFTSGEKSPLKIKLLFWLS